MKGKNAVIKITYTLIRSKKRRRTITLRVMEDGAIIVQSPWHTPKGEIDAFLERKASWISKKTKEQEWFQAHAPHASKGASKALFYLGSARPVCLSDRRQYANPLVFTGGNFVVQRSRSRQVLDLFRDWCREKAVRYIPERVAYYSEKIRLKPKSVRVSHAIYRWGSCTVENRLFFSWRCIMVPRYAIDYIVVHELAHIRHKNHSPAFWKFVESIMPSYKDAQRWLRENDGLLPR